MPALFDEINKNITGRFAMAGDDDADLLEQVCARDGDHIEIGCLYGASAILAALAKMRNGYTGTIYSIDPLERHFSETLNIDVVRHNLKIFDVDGRIEIVRARSNPWPLEMDIRPATMLIDGDHSGASVQRDWDIAKKITRKLVAFHDYGPLSKFGDVTDFVDTVVANDENWIEYARSGALIVFERIS